MSLGNSHQAQEKLQAELKEYRRIDRNLAEITDKLDGLTGFVAGRQPPPAQ